MNANVPPPLALLGVSARPGAADTMSNPDAAIAEHSRPSHLVMSFPSRTPPMRWGKFPADQRFGQGTIDRHYHQGACKAPRAGPGRGVWAVVKPDGTPLYARPLHS